MHGGCEVKIDIVCTSEQHPINPWLEQWRKVRQGTDEVSIIQRTNQLTGGDILFLVSCTEVVNRKIRNKYAHSLVLHASDLPQGRGWSPHIWEILHGAREITVSLIDANDPVDSGAVWDKISFPVPEHALHDEINDALFRTELRLMDRGLEMIARGNRPVNQRQPDERDSPWPRRRPRDSEIDPYQSLASQFDKIRVADPNRYPAFFRLHGYKYGIQIRKMDEDEANND